MIFTNAITTIEAAKAFITELHNSDLMFHFEDSPSNILKGGSDEPLFTKAEAKAMTKRVAELYSFDWGTYDCPIGYALMLMREDEFTEEFFRKEDHGGGAMGWEQLTHDEKVKVMITSSDGCDTDLSGGDDFYIVGAYSTETGDSVMDNEVENGGITPFDAIAKAKEIAARFGGF